MEMTCPSCGATNYDFARYCRKCGVQLAGAEFHEATTRGLDHQRPAEAPGSESHSEPHRGDPSVAAPTTFGDPPRYVPPQVAPIGGPVQQRAATGYPGRVSTSPMATGQVRKGTNWLLVIGIVALLFVLGGGMLTALIIRSVNRSVQTGPDGPTVNLPEGVTFVPKGTTDPEKLPESLKPWYYPDSTIEHSMTASVGSFGGGSVLTMVTEDDLEEVADHYREILSATGSVTEHRDGDSIVFPESGRAIVIKHWDEDPDMTEIVVALGGGPGHPSPPAPGTIPTPPAPPAKPGEVSPPGATPPVPPVPAPAPPPAAPKSGG